MQHAATSLAPLNACAHHVVGAQPEVLQCITASRVNLSLWQRPPLPAISREVSTLTAAQLPAVRHPTSKHSFTDDITALLRALGHDPLSFRCLLSDLCLLADHFFSVSGQRDVKFRLSATDDDNCGRFHVDTRHLRMICTYQGPGTEWLRNEQVDRFLLERGAPNDAVIRFGDASRFEPFWVGIMKGDPDCSGNGLVHRSPPVAGSGQTRVLFCLDAEP